MKKRLFIITAAAACAFSCVFAQNNNNQPRKKPAPVGVIDMAPQPAAGNILPYPIVQKKLPNGLNVVTVQFDSPGLAAFYIVVRVGSRNEIEEGKTGFAHFFEHMMFRGTDKYSKDDYDKVLKSLGASANANTSLDRTIYHMTGNASKLETMFEVEADRFMNLNYSLADFKAEAGAVKGEYTKNNSSPYNQLYEQLQNTAFDKHTYKHTTMGFFEDIVDMPNQFDYSREFFKRYYRPEYTTIIVVGDVTAEKVNVLAEKYFGKWERGSYTAEIPAEPEQTATRYTHLKNGGIPPYLSLNYKGPAFSDKDIDFPTLDVISSLLFSERSELYKKLVLDEQKVRSLSGGAFDSRDPSLFSAEASIVKEEDMQYVKDEIVKALDKIKEVPVDLKLLAETKSFLKYSFAMRIDNPDAIANSLAHYVSLTGCTIK
jgi:zinc protease